MSETPQFELPAGVRSRLARQRPASGHPDADLLAAFLERSLAEDERARVLDHLSACSDCREVVALAQLPEESTARVIAIPARRRTVSWFSVRWAGLAASVLLVFGVFFFAFRENRLAPQQTRNLEPGPVPAQAPPPAANQPAPKAADEIASADTKTEARANRALSKNSVAAINGALTDDGLKKPASTVTAEERSKLLGDRRAGNFRGESGRLGSASSSVANGAGGGVGGGLAPGTALPQPAEAQSAQNKDADAGKFDRPQMRAEAKREDANPFALRGVPKSSPPSATAPAAPAPSTPQGNEGGVKEGKGGVGSGQLAASATPARDQEAANANAPANSKKQASASTGVAYYESFEKDKASKTRQAAAEHPGGPNAQANATQANVNQASNQTNADKSGTVLQSKQAATEKAEVSATTTQDSFSTAQKSGWVVVSGKLLHARSGGKWVPVAFGDCKPVESVAAQADEVWAGCQDGSLYRSADAGRNWAKINYSEPLDATRKSILKIEFDGLLQLTITNADGIRWTTQDGGRTWGRK